MGKYVLRRIVMSVPVLLVISVVVFVVIQLPPGDYMTTIQIQLQSLGGLTEAEAARVAEELRRAYGLDKPLYVQYFVWIKNIITKGDFGFSFQYRKPVAEVIWERLGWTILIASLCHLVSTFVGIAIGIFSATRQYSVGDYVATFFAFVGLSTPSFFLALIAMYIMASRGIQPGGLFSQRYLLAPWSWAKFVDLLKHIWIPIVIVGFAGTARNMRVMRANLLDILNQPYVLTARSKGLPERTVVFKHAVINALHPIIMYQGMVLPFMISGEIVASTVLNIPTAGPMFYSALVSQDMYLAGSFLLLVAVLLVVGNLLADIVLAWVDPRVYYD
ncbi:MAG: ABC transporter permease [Candidatus Caldatribacterium sp.]|uniref:ABC transporter permease n=1 Tax=Candidatus Caldatribacterium sp. TaxID=2282143 RepID=UPI00299316B4|nr:ABC transporter permease [Candidatus Caldatribacterium sp.]MCX7731313.1 ABC transporter permease [Candidatus Caldatribacterium sp.]MDW8080528.1 ABC transporter permease [Candidatus Calescibacterium sp.]